MFVVVIFVRKVVRFLLVSGWFIMFLMIVGGVVIMLVLMCVYFVMWLVVWIEVVRIWVL